MSNFFMQLLLWTASLLAVLGGWWAARFASGTMRHVVRAVITAIAITPSVIQKCDSWVVPAWWLVVMAPMLPRAREIAIAAAIFLVSLIASVLAGRAWPRH